MVNFGVRRILCVIVTSFSLTLAGVGQAHKPLPMQQKIPGAGSNHRLILKDGTYQIVRKYELAGDRVRYVSVERGGDWEEIPADLVDWDATNKWERDHAEPAAGQTSDAMKEAEALDKEEAAEREEQRARTPEVAKGLELPDEDRVFALDTFQGTPELVELPPNDLSIDTKARHGLATFNPMAGSKAAIELPGAQARVHLHVNDPAIYLSLDVNDHADQVLSHSMTVDTGGAKPARGHRRGAQSDKSGFAIVRLDQRKEVRIIGSIHIARDGTVTHDEDVMSAKAEVLPGRHWVKITTSQPLDIGEYALVEILSPSDISQTVWAFRIDPRLAENQGAITPVQRQPSNR